MKDEETRILVMCPFPGGGDYRIKGNLISLVKNTTCGRGKSYDVTMEVSGQTVTLACVDGANIEIVKDVIRRF